MYCTIRHNLVCRGLARTRAATQDAQVAGDVGRIGNNYVSEVGFAAAYCTLSNGSACHASRSLLPDRNMWFGHVSRRLVPKTDFVSRQNFGPDGLKFGWRRFAAQKCPDVSRRTWKGAEAPKTKKMSRSRPGAEPFERVQYLFVPLRAFTTTTHVRLNAIHSLVLVPSYRARCATIT